MNIIIFKTFILTLILNQYECVRNQPEESDLDLIENEVVKCQGVYKIFRVAYASDTLNSLDYYDQAMNNMSFKHIFLMIYFFKNTILQLETIKEKKELCTKLHDAIRIIDIFLFKKTSYADVTRISVGINKMCTNWNKFAEILKIIQEKYLTVFPPYYENGIEKSSDVAINEGEINWELFKSVEITPGDDDETVFKKLCEKVTTTFRNSTISKSEDWAHELDEIKEYRKLFKQPTK